MDASQDLFNAFVSKVMIHNRLVTEKQLKQAKAYLQKRPELNLVDIFLRANLIGEKHARLIQTKFQEYAQKHGYVQKSTESVRKENETRAETREQEPIEATAYGENSHSTSAAEDAHEASSHTPAVNGEDDVAASRDDSQASVSVVTQRSKVIATGSLMQYLEECIIQEASDLLPFKVCYLFLFTFHLELLACIESNPIGISLIKADYSLTVQIKFLFLPKP